MRLIDLYKKCEWNTEVQVQLVEGIGRERTLTEENLYKYEGRSVDCIKIENNKMIVTIL